MIVEASMQPFKEFDSKDADYVDENIKSENEDSKLFLVTCSKDKIPGSKFRVPLGGTKYDSGLNEKVDISP